MHFIQARILRRGVFVKSRQPPDLQYKGKTEAYFTIRPAHNKLQNIFRLSKNKYNDCVLSFD